MALADIFTTSSSAMSAQSLRLNAISSNLANANHQGKTEADTYRAKLPIFETIYLDNKNILNPSKRRNVGVKVSKFVDDQTPLLKEYHPGHPNADENGFVHKTNVNVIEEMANMLDASAAYKNNLEVMNTIKTMLLQTINVLNR